MPKPKNSKKIIKKVKKIIKKSEKKQIAVRSKKTKSTKVIKTRSNNPRKTRIRIARKKPEVVDIVKAGSSPKLLRGMKDILPEDQIIRDYLTKKLIKLSRAYGFQEIVTPILEERALFEKSTGMATDIVEKQMYQFTDRSGKKVVLRPEFTPSIARAYIEHGMFNLTQPVKFFYHGPVFRYERPQAGRYRQFHQFGLEVLGSESALIDAEIILFSQTFFQDLGLQVSIQINSLGCLNCRTTYREELTKYLRFQSKSLCPDCQKRLNKNPLRVLDCKVPQCREITRQAPQLINFLCPDCKKHFTRVLESLDEANVVYSLNPYLVRGLDYYTRTVFELWPISSEEKEKENSNSGQTALGGGGRYDTLLESLSGRETPATGLSYGIERIINEMKIQKVRIPRSQTPQVFFAQVGETSARQALRIFNDLQGQGIKVVENFAKTSLKAQMKIADEIGVKLTLILGQQETKDKTIIIRDMKTGNQEKIDIGKLVKELKKRLK